MFDDQRLTGVRILKDRVCVCDVPGWYVGHSHHAPLALLQREGRMWGAARGGGACWKGGGGAAQMGRAVGVKCWLD